MNEISDQSEHSPGGKLGSAECCRVNYALVVRVDVEDIPGIVRFIQSLPGSKIVYQAKSLGRMTIVRE